MFIISFCLPPDDVVHVSLCEEPDHDVIIPLSVLLDSDYSQSAREARIRETTPSIAQVNHKELICSFMAIIWYCLATTMIFLAYDNKVYSDKY